MEQILVHVAQLVGVTESLQVLFPVGASMREAIHSVFLTSVFLSLPSPLSKVSVSSGEDTKQNKTKNTEQEQAEGRVDLSPEEVPVTVKKESGIQEPGCQPTHPLVVR